MKLFCEIMVKDVLPGLRAMIAQELINSYGMNQTEAAKMLDISQPAISQYTRKIRGERKNLLQNEIVVTAVKDISSKLYAKELNDEGLANEFCKICNSLSENTTEKGFVKIKMHEIA